MWTSKAHVSVSVLCAVAAFLARTFTLLMDTTSFPVHPPFAHVADSRAQTMSPLGWLVSSDASLRVVEAVEGSPMLVPSLRLLYCSVPKVASTILKRLFHRVNGLSSWNSSDVDVVHRPDKSGAATMRGMDVARANALLSSTTWLRLVVVRDPVERFASAFLDKCYRKKLFLMGGSMVRNLICPIASEPERDNPVSVLTALESAAAATATSGHSYEVGAALGGVHALDAHFIPQALLCDLRLVRPAYTVLTLADVRARGLRDIVPLLRGLIGAEHALVDAFSAWVEDSDLAVKAPPSTRERRVVPSLLGGNALSNSSTLVDERTRATSAADLAWTWRAAAEAGDEEAAAFLHRLYAFYASDYSLFGAYFAPKHVTTRLT